MSLFPGIVQPFLSALKRKKIDWNLFDSALINRFDLNCLRSIQPNQERQVADFFKQSEKTIHSKEINIHINSTTKDLSLKIASKRSNRSAKIYDVGRWGHPLGRFVHSSWLSFQLVEWRNCSSPQLPPLGAAYLSLKQNHTYSQISQTGNRILFQTILHVSI